MTSTASVVVAVPGETVIVSPSIGYVISSPGQQGPPGPQGIPGNLFTYPTIIPISGQRMVTLDDSNRVIYADSSNINHANRVFGMSVGAAAPNSNVTIKSYGEITENSWNWAINQPVYLYLNGLLTQSPPEAPLNAFSLVIGTAITSTTIFINIMPPIFLI